MSSQRAKDDTHKTPVDTVKPSIRFLASLVPGHSAQQVIPPPPPPPRRELTTRESLSEELARTEQEMAERGHEVMTAPPETMLQFVALEVIRQRQEMAQVREHLKRVEKRQAERVVVTRRGFNWMKALAGTAAAAATVVPIMAMAWGEWIRANPAAAATGFGSFVTVVLGLAGAAFRVRERRSAQKAQAAEEHEAVATNDAHR